MTDDRPRNQQGQYNDRFPAETVLDVFDRADDLAEPVTATDVVDALDVSRRTALNKLNELVAAGALESRTVGARARVFWRPIPADADARLKRLSTDLGEPITVGRTVYEDGDAHPLDTADDSDRDPEADPAIQSGVRATASESTVSAADAPESVAGVDVDALDLPGRGDDLRRRQAAVSAVLAHLREHGEAQAGDLKEIAWETDGGSYDDSESLWTNCVYQRALKPLDAVESAGPSGKWRWVGDE